MQHPNQALLDELKIATERMPAVVPLESKQKILEFHAKYSADPKASPEEISAAIIEAGRTAWPYRKALGIMIDRYGREKQAAHFKERLTDKLAKKYEDFARLHSDTPDPWRHKDFESAFTADEKFQIEEALLEARDKARDEVEILVSGEKRAEYETELAAWQKKQELLAGKIQELRALADQSEKWAPEILDKVRVFEEGWSAVEKDADMRIVEGEIGYYRDIVE